MFVRALGAVSILASLFIAESSFASDACSNDSIESKIEAERVFKENLKAPSTAKFVSIKTKVVQTEADACAVFAKGQVDAQNAYGAVLRQTLYVMLACNKTVGRCSGSNLFDSAKVPSEYK
jgi:hypothetical protein